MHIRSGKILARRNNRAPNNIEARGGRAVATSRFATLDFEHRWHRQNAIQPALAGSFAAGIELVTDSFRWRIAVLVACAIAISYFDRQTLPVAITAIQRDIPISNTEFSNLQAAFLLAYAIMYARRQIDRRAGHAARVPVNHALVVACLREPRLGDEFWHVVLQPVFARDGRRRRIPGRDKSRRRVVSASERSTAMGIMNAGTAVGAVIAPPLIAAVTVARELALGIFSFGRRGTAWTVWWGRDYRNLAAPAELAVHSSDFLVSAVLVSRGLGSGLGEVPERCRVVFLSLLASQISIRCTRIRRKEVGYFAWIPYAAAGVGCLVGGWFSSWLLRRGHSLNFSRKLALGLSAAVMPLIALVTHSPSNWPSCCSALPSSDSNPGRRW